MVFQWFPMVANHWSDDGMVTIHCSGLDGTLLAEHKEKRCNNRNCRVGAYYGYIVIRGGDRIYLPNCLNNEFLVVSSQTAFHINYLLEVVTDLHLLQVGRNLKYEVV